MNTFRRACNKHWRPVRKLLCSGMQRLKISLAQQYLLTSQMGYSTLLIDFMGSGASQGNETAEGFMEAGSISHPLSTSIPHPHLIASPRTFVLG